MNLNAAHLHIMLNHFPIVGVFVGAGLLTLWLLWRRECVLLAGLWTLVGSGLASIPVYLLGDEAEDVVEGMKGISRASIERHQDAATWALVGLILLGLAAAWALWRQRRSPVTRGVVTWIWILSLVVSGIVTWTAERGGEIHHPEIRPGWQRPPETGSEGEEPGGAALRWSPTPTRVARAART
jgi:uncharacterized membrane protein